MATGSSATAVTAATGVTAITPVISQSRAVANRPATRRTGNKQPADRVGGPNTVDALITPCGRSEIIKTCTSHPQNFGPPARYAISVRCQIIRPQLDSVNNRSLRTLRNFGKNRSFNGANLLDSGRNQNRFRSNFLPESTLSPSHTTLMAAEGQPWAQPNSSQKTTVDSSGIERPC